MAEPNLPPLPNTPAPPITGGIPKKTAEGLVRVKEHVSSFASRVRLVEDQLGNIRSHLELLDSSMIEKHKALVKEIRTLESGSRDLRAEISKLNDLIERTIHRLEGLATREEVQVLERYAEMWKPMNFVTKSELTALIQKIIKDSTKNK